MANAYDEAIKVYSNYLPQLQAKYNTLLTNLENQRNSSLATQGAMFGTQKTGLTNELAKRGLTAMAGDTYFDTQQGALASNQNIQRNELSTKYDALSADVVSNQNSENTDVMAAIANIKKDKAAAKQAQKNWEKEYKAAKKRAEQSQSNWQAEFDYSKAKSNSGSSQQDILDKYVATLNDAAMGSYGLGNNTTKGIRERLRDQAIAAGLNKDIANKYMETFLPIGWEWNKN